MKVVIMAGGKGRRLRPLTLEKSKTMVPIANKPILHHLIVTLSSEGYHDIVITTGRNHGIIKDYLEDGKRYDIAVKYIEEKKPLGTAGSIKNAMKFLDETFLVIAGDHLTDIKLKNMMEFHKQNDGIATVALTTVDRPYEYGIVDIDTDYRIKRFYEKPSKGEVFSTLISTGIYIFNPEILDYIGKGKQDFAKDVFPRLLNEGEKIYGFLASGNWVDVGRPSSYNKAVRQCLNKLTETRMSGNVGMGDVEIVGPVSIGPNVSIRAGSKVIGPSVIGSNTRIGKEVLIGPYSTIGANVKISRGTKVLSAKIFDDVIVGSHTMLTGCIIDESACIGNDAEIKNNAVIGARVEIEKGVLIGANTKIWPDLVVKKGKIVSKDIISGS